MDNNFNYETFLFISTKKLIITVYADSSKKIYEEVFDIENNSELLEFDRLDYFLNKNIFKIEKKIKNFINKVLVILDLNNFFPIEISVQKKNHDNSIQLSDLKYLLYEAKNCCKKTLDKKKIVHMIIKKYIIDNQSYSFLPNQINCNNFSLDVKFICLSNNFVQNLENVLKKYHISLNQVVSAKYIENFLSDQEKNIFLMTNKIINGHNPNEIILVDKSRKNEGFFEKFFNFFN